MFISSYITIFFFFLVLTKRRNDLKRPTATYNDLPGARNNLKRPTTSKKQPETTYNMQETIWNDPQWVRHNLQWPEHTYNEQRKDEKGPTASRFSGYFTIFGKRFSSLKRFSPNIGLLPFEHCFTENQGEKRASSIYYHASSVNYHIYFLWDIRFIFFLSGFCISRERERLNFLVPLYHFHPLQKIVYSSAFAFFGEV